MARFEYRRWSVQKSAKQPLLEFLIEGLRSAGCKVLWASDPAYAPFMITYETPLGERQGVLAYAFFANGKVTKNRPEDEHRFQLKYGGDLKAQLPIEHDASQLVTTLLVGIDPVRGIMVGADPLRYHMSQMSLSVEFKRSHLEAVNNKGWHAWERARREDHAQSFEVLVGVPKHRVLDFIRFERLAFGLDAGHRQLLAEQLLGEPALTSRPHALTEELRLSERQVLDLIQGASRLKMAVRGWVAEHHLEDLLQQVPGVSDCRRLDEEGRPDIELRFEGGDPLLIECKNVLRERAADGSARVDFQRTRAAKGDPCSRYYRPGDFHVLAACLHAVTQEWEYRFIPTTALPSHKTCHGRIQSNLRVGPDWYENPAQAFSVAAALP